MSFKEQLETLKDNWVLIAGFIIVLLLLNGAPAIQSFTASPEQAVTHDMRSSGAADRDVQTTSSLTVSTKDVESQASAVQRITDRYNAIILNEYQDRQDNELESIRYHLTVPVANQTSLIDGLRSLGDVKDYTVRRDDITERRQDLEDDLAAAQEKLRRVNDLYETSSNEVKADLIDRIIDQERRISTLQRQLSDTTQRVTRTTVYFTLEDLDYLTSPAPSIKDLINRLVSSAVTLLNVIVALIPWAIIAGLLYWAYRRSS